MRKRLLWMTFILATVLIGVSMLTPYRSPAVEVKLIHFEETEGDYIYKISVANVGDEALTFVGLKLFYADLNDANDSKRSDLFGCQTERSTYLSIKPQNKGVYGVVVHKEDVDNTGVPLSIDRPKVSLTSLVWHRVIPVSFKIEQLSL